MKEVVIGIDLGTTFSAAAIYEADGKCRILPNGSGELLTPSVVNLRDEKHPVVGMAAVSELGFAAEYIIRHVKRSIGKRDAQGNPITVFIHPDSGKAYTAEEISSMIIRHIVEGVEAGQGVKVVGVVITVPAYFDDGPRIATRRAGELAGVNVLSIVNEPTAAGLAFGLDKGESGTFVVFDLGGGTFDITIVQIKNKDFTALATDGDRDMGGTDVDNFLLEKAIAAFKAQHGIEISAESDLPAWIETLTKCEIAKKTLSQAETASFMMSAQGQRMVFDVTRADFNALIAPIIEKARAITQRTLTAANLQPKDITGVLLVGGSTRIVAVRDMLTDLFGKKLRTDTKPDEAVAMGAAIYAARIGADRSVASVDTRGQPVLPPPIRKLRDVIAHGLGCLALDAHGVRRNSIIIPPNTPLPAEKTGRFSLVQQDQTEAEIVVAQGPDGALPSECPSLAELVLSGLPTGPLENRVKVTYGLTAEGILTITATDTISGKSTSDVKHGLGSIVSQS